MQIQIVETKHALHQLAASITPTHQLRCQVKHNTGGRTWKERVQRTIQAFATHHRTPRSPTPSP